MRTWQKKKDVMSRTIAQHVRFKTVHIFLAVLCKATTWNHHNLRRLWTETTTESYFNFHLEVNVSFICYAEVEMRYRMRRYTNAAILEFKAEIHLLIEIFLGIAVLTAHYNVKWLTFCVVRERKTPPPRYLSFHLELNAALLSHAEVNLRCRKRWLTHPLIP